MGKVNNIPLEDILLQEGIIEKLSKIFEKLHSMHQEESFILTNCKPVIFDKSQENCKVTNNSHLENFQEEDCLELLNEYFNLINRIGYEELSWIGIGFITYSENLKEKSAVWSYYVNEKNINKEIFEFIEENANTEIFNKEIILSYDILREIYEDDYYKNFFVLIRDEESINLIEDIKKDLRSFEGVFYIKYEYISKKNFNITQKEDIHHILNYYDKYIKISTNDENKGDLDKVEKSRLRKYILLMEMLNDEFKFLISIPAWNFKGVSELYSLATILSFKKIPSKDKLKKILAAVRYINYLHSLLTISILNLRARNYAVKSAKSTIMARNMSHNLGSHVLNRVSENIYFEKFEDNRDLYRYLQQRMDFIAQITTEIPQWTTNHYFVKEIMSGFLKQKHLLKYIVKAEGVKGKTIGKVYEVILSDNHSHMCINVSKEEKGENKEYKVAIIYKDKKAGKYKIDLDKVQNDLQISVPGGFVGFHALYSMLENIIRNAAKHSYAGYPENYKNDYCGSGNKMDLDINIKLERIGDNDIVCEIYDNVSFISGLKVDENKKFDEYKEIKILCLEEMETNDVIEKLRNIIKDSKNIKISVEKISKADLKNDKFKDRDILFYILVNTCTLRKNKELRNILIEEPKKSKTGGSDNKVLLENPNVRLIDKFHICNIKNIRELKRVLKDLYIPLHIKLQEKLDKTLINEDGSLRQGDWGMAELKICAGFLTKADLMEINNNKRRNGEKIIEAVATTGLCVSYNKDNNIIIEQEPVYRLGFRFRLLPPKRVVIFDSERKFPIESKEILIKTRKEA